MVRIATTWTITPPPGLTKKGDAKRFSDRTVEALRFAAQDHASAAIEKVQAAWGDYYPKGSGRLPGSMKYEVQASQDGVNVKIKIGSYKHLQYISRLGGGEYKERPYIIAPRVGTHLKFRDSDSGRVVVVQKVVHPGFGGRDLLADVMAEEGELFRLDAIEVVSRSILTLTTPGVGRTTRELRRR